MSSRLTRAKSLNSPDVDRFEKLTDWAFRKVWEALLDEGTDEELPATLVEALRKDGLL